MRHFGYSKRVHRGRFSGLTGPMGRRVLKFDGAFGPEGCGGGFAADYKKSRPAPSVISTEAGQPPIGKPLIVQARGQLRLTWRLYAESPQSGEISPSHGTGGITVGDLSAQSFHRVPVPYHPWRHAAPLEMTVAAGAPLVISTEAERSGEISPSHGTGSITEGDLSAQSIMGAVPVCLP